MSVQGLESIIVVITENGWRIPPLVKDAVDDDRCLYDMKCDVDAAAPCRDSQTGPQVVTARSSFRNCHKTETLRDDPICMVLGTRGATIARDHVVKPIEVAQSLGSEDNLTRHRWLFSSAWRGACAWPPSPDPRKGPGSGLRASRHKPGRLRRVTNAPRPRRVLAARAALPERLHSPKHRCRSRPGSQCSSPEQVVD
jgi:hypothetical protein